MIEIIKAEMKDEAAVLEILDGFRTAGAKIIDPNGWSESTVARENGSALFREVIISANSIVFLAKDVGKHIGVITGHLVPQLRRGCHVTEIEEMFVADEYQGKGVAQELLQAIEVWAKEKGCQSLRLQSALALERAHAFYKKIGFFMNAHGFQRKIN